VDARTGGDGDVAVGEDGVVGVVVDARREEMDQFETGEISMVRSRPER
jgi:hypothetical protein